MSNGGCPTATGLGMIRATGSSSSGIWAASRLITRCRKTACIGESRRSTWSRAPTSSSMMWSRAASPAPSGSTITRPTRRSASKCGRGSCSAFPAWPATMPRANSASPPTVFTGPARFGSLVSSAIARRFSSIRSAKSGCTVSSCVRRSCARANGLWPTPEAALITRLPACSPPGAATGLCRGSARTCSICRATRRSAGRCLKASTSTTWMRLPTRA